MRHKLLFTATLLFFLILRTDSTAVTDMSEERLRAHIKVLACDIGERNYTNYQNLERAAQYIKDEFKRYGYEPEEQIYTVHNQSFKNIIATKSGKDRKGEIVIICAHYDSVVGAQGADDNASGVAGLLELAGLLYKENLNKTIKFIAFVNEEPPFYATEDMGSFRYAKEAKKKGECIKGVLCLESIGFYSDKKNSQAYPFGLKLFFPDKGNFIGIVSNLSSQSLLKRIIEEFKKTSQFPLEYLIAPIFLAPQICLSDHWSFWKFGYKAVMITDTAFLRNPYYHTPNDTVDKINYRSMSSVIQGLYHVLNKLAG